LLVLQQRVDELEARVTFLDGGPPECTDGDTQECNTEYAGACYVGQRLCDGGTWGVCVPPLDPSDPACTITCPDVPNATVLCYADGSYDWTCDPYMDDCDGDEANGCETGTFTNFNCIACGNVCPSGWECNLDLGGCIDPTA
jgi:hypothetical protein